MAKLSESNESKLGFILLGCVSIGSLFGAFAGNLESFEVWSQREQGQFGQTYNQIFILTENEPKLPYGINKKKATKVASNYDNLQLQKFLLVGVSLVSSGFALLIGESKLLDFEIESETKKIESSAKKEYITRQMKQKWALMSEAQKQLFREELRELIALSGGDEVMEATEVNATDKFINANYLLAEGHNIDMAVAQTWGYKPGSPEHEEMKAKFTQWIEE
ncbi:hypothetical protein [Nostoc sphaeroides]|uniref:Uncharacterized protein n=1 Tax=Nostoc sphaeroides CCNUC1 TaxID=2653204 RepID=A0A5P8WJZ6_9NOSO|nr:hypothetical protein [Nostoc sphaeroides]QFS52890.1 hypothetical protein GXM_10154 [Nostoc sphaeroides CCNUC1]